MGQGLVDNSIAAVRVSAVVSTRNRGELIRETLEALCRQDHSSYDIIVVDQSTDDRTKNTFESIDDPHGRMRYIRTDTTGVGRGRNVGLETSDAEIVAYTDDDCIMEPDWLTQLSARFDDSSVAAVFGRLLPHERQARDGTEVGYKDSKQDARFSELTPPWYIGHGGNMAFRRSDLLAIGGFDTVMCAGGPLLSNEDGDVAFRMLTSGRTVVYSPDVLGYHKHWKSWPEQQKMERAYGIGAGAQFGKYLRCGQPYGRTLLRTWIWELGVRRVGSGLLKWRSSRVVYLGVCQLIFPLIGLLRSRRYPIDTAHCVYKSPNATDAASECSVAAVG